ncbi:hypothetical protein [Burkholderia stagnalis]|uniref:Uncharacterized protein n=1 Tax=Burkholderia stagnalis TaxID=1503054 RepID=A0A107AM68_9BURK|nr:hypothetical protein [Burkholderia stagnalis]KVZ05923.1 hypothetical protein WT35_24340 [Burkholderia stagnalis]KWA50577.1 hypothetical protein WT43_29205 [Burkholderia stagnalis]KWA61707.1 hypothetical protein WT42_03020 [Burkholderia stagnalis]KWA66088.1 hypothetical protein WT44_07605 [Burkholderia stagnalis]KWD04201.1 hypothetical protein WT46_14160 [Burkholderia stagnalis]
MRVSDVLRRIGRPISYYPGLAHILGSVNAAVLFCQLFYWQDKTTHELGVHKTSDELRKETGLSYEEQRTARRLLKKAGVLVETEKRLEHKIYFKIDEDALERIIETPAEQSPSDPKSAEAGSPNSRNGESPFRETGNLESGKSGNSSPPTGQPPDGGAGDAQSVYTGIDYCIDYKQQQRAGARDRAVDNTTAGALLLPDGENGDKQNRTGGGHDASTDAPSADERAALELLRALEAARGAGVGITAARDLSHVRGWLASGATLADLSAAYRRAVAARERDKDQRPVNAGFLARFVDEVRAPAGQATTSAVSGEWWESASGIAGQGDRVGVQQREKEPTPDFLVRVAKASGRGPWIDHVLREGRKGNEQRYQQIVNFFGDALLPVDFYAS